jgi:hypothetical protein
MRIAIFHAGSEGRVPDRPFNRTPGIGRPCSRPGIHIEFEAYEEAIQDATGRFMGKG